MRNKLFTFSVWWSGNERFDPLPRGFRRSTPGYYNTLRLGPVSMAFGFDADE